jgi:hypothetical protein
MGQSQSQSLPDLVTTEDVQFDKKVVVINLTPFFIIKKDEFESNLDTGNDELNEQVINQLCQRGDHTTQIIGILSKVQCKLINYTLVNGSIYLTVEKLTGKRFKNDDCVLIREAFSEYNRGDNHAVILKEEDAMDSLFYDELGDLGLGFNVCQIDYI